MLRLLWKASRLFFIGLLGASVVVCSVASAASRKPPAKRTVEQRAPRAAVVPRRLNPQQNVGRRMGPAIGTQPGNRAAAGRLPPGPLGRNRSASIANRLNGRAFDPRTRQFGMPPSRGAFARMPNAAHPFARFSARPGGPRQFANRGNNRFGSLANRGRGGNGAPPGTRLIDMRVMPLPPGSGLPPVAERRFRSNEVVLQFAGDRTPAEVAAVAQRFGLSIVAQQNVGALRRTMYTFRINNGQSVPNVISAIDGAGLNAAAQPNYTYNLTQDRRAGAMAGDPAQYVVAKLQLDAVHRISTGNDVVIALIDSRVDARQPDFAGRIVDSYDAGCGAGAPPDAHGTGMAGAIASHVGLLGVAPNAKILAICAFGGSGTPAATSASIIRGLDYAIEHGAKVVNMSFAGPQDPALAQELQIAREKGILIVAAAGNAGAASPPLYPGADPNVMAVTATDERDNLFSGANQGSYVAVAAPGVNVLVPAPHGGVELTTGTSVATAHVSGVAALLLAEQPARTPEQIRAILVDTARHLGAEGINPQFGAGLVDPLKALRAAPQIVGEMSAPAAEPPVSH
jgi:hypothetical protein